VVLGLSAASVAVFLPAWMPPGRSLVGGDGDPNQSMWFLAWTPWAITHGHNPLLTSVLNAPTGVNLMWNSSALLLAILLWPVTAVFGVVTAYNTLVTLGIAVSAYCAYRVGRRLLDTHGAAICMGLAYGCCPFLIVQSPGHGKVLWAFMPPLLLLVLHDLLVVRRRRPWVLGIALGVLVAAQALVFEEGVALGMIAACAGLAVLAVSHRDRIRTAGGRVLQALPWSAAAFAIVAGGPIAVQFLGPNRVSGTVPGGNVYVADIANLVLPTPANWLAPHIATDISAKFSGNGTENGAYLGVVVIAIIAAVLVARWSRPLVRWSAFTGAILTVLSFGPQIHIAGHVSRIPLPWRVIEAVPILGSAYPARLFIYIDLLAALVIGIFIDAAIARIREGRRRRSTTAGLVIALAGVAMTFAPREPVATTAVTVPAYFTMAEGGARALPADSVALVAPFTHDGPSDSPMVWQAAAMMRYRMPEGYFVRLDDGTREDGPPPSATSRVMVDIEDGGGVSGVTAADRRAMTEELAMWHVTTVIVGPTDHRDHLEQFFRELLHNRGSTVGGVTTWRVGIRVGDA